MSDVVYRITRSLSGNCDVVLQNLYQKRRCTRNSSAPLCLLDAVSGGVCGFDRSVSGIFGLPETQRRDCSAQLEVSFATGLQGRCCLCIFRDYGALTAIYDDRIVILSCQANPDAEAHEICPGRFGVCLANITVDLDPSAFDYHVGCVRVAPFFSRGSGRLRFALAGLAREVKQQGARPHGMLPAQRGA